MHKWVNLHKVTEFKRFLNPISKGDRSYSQYYAHVPCVTFTITCRYCTQSVIGSVAKLAK